MGLQMGLGSGLVYADVHYVVCSILAARGCSGFGPSYCQNKRHLGEHLVVIYIRYSHWTRRVYTCMFNHT